MVCVNLVARVFGLHTSKNTAMRLNLIILPVLTFAAVLLVGCKPANQPSEPKSPDARQAASNSTTATNPATPSVSVAISTNTHQLTIRIKAGPGAIKDSSGNQWLEEKGFTGGDVIERPGLEIANTASPDIYRSERYGMESFVWKIPNGKYQVKLHFCETFEGITGPGQRVFSFSVEDREFKDFDVWAKADGWGRAHVETVNVEIADGQLDIKFTSQVENPEINGIEISPVP